MAPARRHFRKALESEKISSGVVHEVPTDFKRALTSDPKSVNSMGGYYAARTQRVDMLD